MGNSLLAVRDINHKYIVVGEELEITVENQESISLRIPAISVEVKSYVDATMLGEVMNTSRKIKGANPQSKCVLLTWINSFSDVHALEAAYDSSIDEIIVLSEEKRKKKEEKRQKIIFTKEGLREYYSVIMEDMRTVRNSSSIPKMGRIISYLKYQKED